MNKAQDTPSTSEMPQARPESTIERILFWVAIPFGLFVLFWGLGNICEAFWFSLIAERTAGMIVQVEREDRERNPRYTPSCRFRDAHGMEHEFKGTSNSEPTFATGDPVWVLYRLETPNKARMQNYDWLMPNLCIASVGGFFLLLWVGVYRVRARRLAPTALVNEPVSAEPGKPVSGYTWQPDTASAANSMMPSDPKQISNREVTRFLYVLSLMLFCFAAVQTWNSWQFQRGSLVAQGIVVRMDKHVTGGSKKGSSVHLIPIVRFTDAWGIEREAPGRELLAPHKVGDVVSMRYSMANPNEAEEAGFWSLWGWPIGLSLTGIFFCVLAWRWSWQRK